MEQSGWETFLFGNHQKTPGGCLRELGYELVKPHVETRSRAPNLHSVTREAMASICVRLAPPAEQPGASEVRARRKRSLFCRLH